NGDVFVVESFVNRISVLRAPADAPQAAQREVFIEGFRRPHGVQFVGDALYVADLERVWRVPYQAGDLKASARPEPVPPDGALGTQGGHFTRNLIFAPGGAHFFVAIGSAGNIGEEPAPRASVVRFRADGSNRETVTTGTRNPVGLAFRPGTDELWTTVN